MRDPMRNPSFTSWMNTEEERIRAEFKSNRDKIQGDALLVGFEGHSIKDTESREVIGRYQQSIQDEETAVADFRDRAIKHEERRLMLTEEDTMQKTRRVWGLK